MIPVDTTHPIKLEEIHIEAEAVPVEKQLRLETEEHSKDELVRGLGQLVIDPTSTIVAPDKGIQDSSNQCLRGP